ncbi:SurA N-terminal domain-containing protein [Roseicyclus sp.]|uniref:SurA N-terminal domain-containing protein n=1 Tax=Roseicyclus sp. TaxID=1914329 RepID=UPI003F6AE8CA
MAKTAVKKASNLFVWIIMGLLFIALAGFGIGSFSGGASRVGAVGDVEISADDYARALDQEIRARIAQTGQPITLANLRAQGVDQAVLQSLVARAALVNEAQMMGLSVGDAEVARQITQIASFQGLDGAFDRESYEFTLRQNGLNPAEFEQEVREDTARALLQAAVIGGIAPDQTITEALVAYQAETRDARLLIVTQDDLPEGVPLPDATDLEAHYAANPARFTRPEARAITFAWVTPTMLMDTIPVDEAALRALYDDRAALYRQPERRLLEQLVFADTAQAQAAFDAMLAGETGFDAILEERGLSLEDVDLGEVTREDLLPEAAELIFGDQTSEIIGPAPTRLGPALFRVNAVLDASEITFEEAEEELRAELAAEAARRAIDDLRDPVDDLLAEGLTLEELAETTELVLGRIDYTPTSEEGIAAYDAFREAGLAVNEGDFPELLTLSDGGLFALRLDAVVPPTLPPLAEIRPAVRADWRADAIRAAINARAEVLLGMLAQGAALEELGQVAIERDIRRQGFIPDAPPTLVAQLFQLDAVGDVVMVPGADRSLIVQLDAINPAARDDPNTQILLQVLGQAVAQTQAQDVFEAYGQALQTGAGIRLDQAVINAVHAQFP